MLIDEQLEKFYKLMNKCYSALYKTTKRALDNISKKENR